LVVKKLFSGELIEGALGLGVAMAEAIPVEPKLLACSQARGSHLVGSQAGGNWALKKQAD